LGLWAKQFEELKKMFENIYISISIVVVCLILGEIIIDYKIIKNNEEIVDVLKAIDNDSLEV